MRQLITAVISILFCSALLLNLAVNYFERQQLASLEQIAGIIAENSSKALTDKQKYTLPISLNYLNSLPAIEQVAVKDEVKRDKGRFIRNGLDKYHFVLPYMDGDADFVNDADKINFYLKVFDKSRIEQIGTICIRADRSQTQVLGDQFMKFGGLIILLSILVALVIASLLQFFLGRPEMSIISEIEKHLETKPEEEMALQEDPDNNRLIELFNGLSQRAYQQKQDEEMLADLQRKISLLEAEIASSSEQLTSYQNQEEDSESESSDSEANGNKPAQGLQDSGISSFEADKIALEMEHARKVAELTALLKKREGELERHRKECEEFTLTAAEDLRAPIRSIRGFGKMLQEEISNGSSEQAQLYVNYINGGAQQMEYLLEDLQTYFKIRPLREEEYQPVDIAQLIETIKSNLAANLERTGALITQDEHLPVISGDRMHLGVLFQNLIANAIKFRSDKREPEIHIGVKEENHEWVFSVIDNGIGIDPELGKNIFQLFHKVNPDYPGTGFGLPICRKIVEINGGTIWFESELGFGTTFYFTLEK